MQGSLLTILLSDGVARAVCWTLVHSLWEGVVAAMIAGLIIGCTRRLPAAIRYNLLTADLLLFLLVAGITFSYELRQGNRPMPASANPIAAGTAGKAVRGTEAVGVNLIQGRQANFIQRAGDFLNTHAAAVTLIWLACLILQLLRLTGGVYKLRRLRRNNIRPPGEWWEERLLVLVDRLGIKRRVTLLQSGLVKSPAAFGFFKPSILVPLGMLANLPSDQIEAILLHELAHIRRGDYLKNLLLHFTEAIFFFNPGLRWIATLIRREREACCDDMVVAATEDRNSYFEALVAFAQFAVNGWAADGSFYAQQLSRGKTDLIWRIRRMMEQENRKLQTMEKTILSFGLMVMVSVCLVSMKEKQRDTVKLVLPNTVIYARIDTVPQWQKIDSVGGKLTFTSVTTHSHEHNGQKKFQALAIDDNGHRYEIRKINGEVTEFKVNGKLIANEDYGRYAEVLEKIEAEQRKTPKPLIPMEPLAPLTPAARLLPGTPTPLLSGNATLLPPGAASPLLPRTPKPLEPLAPMKPMESAALAEIVTQTEMAPTLSNPLVYTKNPNPIVRLIVLDLIANRLIDHVDQLSFTLDADQLMVNGVKQPDAIYLTYKEKYIQYPKDHFIYSQYYTPHSSGSHCEVNTGP